MIEIDIAPAPSSASSSSSVPPGAADDFASALEHAGGHDERGPAPRTNDAVRREEMSGPDEEAGTAPTEDADSGPVADEVSAEDAPDTDAPTSPAPTAHQLIALTTATTSEPQSVEATIETELEIELEAVGGEAVDASAARTVAGLVDASESETSAPIEPIVADAEAVVASEGDLEAEVSLVSETASTDPVVAAARAGSPHQPTSEQVAVEADVVPAGTAIVDEAPAAAPAVAVVSSAAPIEESSSPMVGEEPPAATVPDVAEVVETTDAEIAPTSTPASTPAPTTAAAPRGDAVIAAVTEAAPPASVSTPPTATTVDPTAAAEAAALAELEVPTPPQQIAEALRDVRRMADGSHRLSLQLYPEELGVVQLEVAVREGQLHLRAATELDSTRRLLNASLPELREQLADAGVSAGSLEVGAETAGGDRSASDDAPATVRSGFDEAAPIGQPTTSEIPTLTAPGRLDVRL